MKRKGFYLVVDSVEICDFGYHYGRGESYPKEPVIIWDFKNRDLMKNSKIADEWQNTIYDSWNEFQGELTRLFNEWLVQNGHLKPGKPVKLRIVQKYGCSCGCSPAWRIHGLRGMDRKEFHVKFKVIEKSDEEKAAIKALIAAEKAAAIARKKAIFDKKVAAIPKTVVWESDVLKPQLTFSVEEDDVGVKHLIPNSRTVMVPSGERISAVHELLYALGAERANAQEYFMLTKAPDGKKHLFRIQTIGGFQKGFHETRNLEIEHVCCRTDIEPGVPFEGYDGQRGPTYTRLTRQQIRELIPSGTISTKLPAW